MNAPMHPQYRNYQQQTQRSPHAPTTSRRGPGLMVGGNHQSATASSQMIAHKIAHTSEMEAAQRRARKPTDKNMPDGIEDVIIGDGAQQYKNLREVERRLDAAMVRKRLDLQSARYRRHERKRTLRIWISNTADNQPWQQGDLEENTFDFSSGINSTYKVKIEGRLLDDAAGDNDTDSDEEDEAIKSHGTDSNAMDHDGKSEANGAPKPALPRKKLSSFFRSMAVDFNRNKGIQQPDVAYTVEWEKPPVTNPQFLPPGADFDFLEFERKSDENINCTINLVRDEMPERFKLSKALAEILDSEEETREGIVYGIWDYISVMNLQQDDEKRMIQCDDALREAFKRDTIIFPHIPQLITPHLSPLPPVKLPYTIRVDPDYHSNPTKTIYDIPIAVEDALTQRMSRIIADPSYGPKLNKIKEIDDKLALIVQAIAQSKARQAFFTSMSKDPARFVRRWTSSQKKDLEIILGEASRGVTEDGLSEEFRRGGKEGVWGTENVRESVGLMVSKR